MENGWKVGGVSMEGEQVIERLRRLNDGLKQQLKRQRDKIRQQTKDNHRCIGPKYYLLSAFPP